MEGRGGRAYCRVQNLGLGLRRDVAASPTYRKFFPDFPECAHTAHQGHLHKRGRIETGRARAHAQARYPRPQRSAELAVVRGLLREADVFPNTARANVQHDNS